MNKKLYWGLGVLFGLIIGGFVFLLVQQKAELNEWEADAAKDKKLTTAETPPLVKNKPPPPVPGYKWVQHGDHYDKVPISDPNGTPIAQGAAPVTTYNGPLTFHAELLKTNPVKALRLQAEERGHVNAKWIPPFPPDDVEAQELAKAVYALIYNTNSDTPKLGIGGNSMLMMEEIYKKYSRTSARSCDLTKLTWVALSYQIDHYNSDGLALLPSDYFPEHISDLK